MKIAYIVVAHTNPVQVARLTSHLGRDGSRVFLHIDRKVDRSPFEAAVATRANIDVHWVDRRIDVRWGGFSMVRAVLASIESVLAADTKFDYVAFLTGQCYPIQPIRKLRDYLREHAGSQIISALSIEEKWPSATRRYEKRYLHDWPNPLVQRTLRMANAVLPERRFLSGYRPYGGSVYFFLTRSCVEHVAAEAQHNSRYVRFLRSCALPDELFFHTLVMNSTFANRVVNWNPWFIKWTSPESHPRWLGVGDLEEMLASDRFFARKFDSDRDGEVLDRLDDAIAR